MLLPCYLLIQWRRWHLLKCGGHRLYHYFWTGEARKRVGMLQERCLAILQPSPSGEMWFYALLPDGRASFTRGYANSYTEHIEFPCVYVWRGRRRTRGCLRFSRSRLAGLRSRVEPWHSDSFFPFSHYISFCISPLAALLHTEPNVCCVCSSLETLHTAGAEHLTAISTSRTLARVCVRLCVLVWMRLCVQVSKTV